MSKKLIITIKKDGSIDAQTKGIKGKKCEDYIKIVEELTNSKSVNIEYTAEYNQQEEEAVEYESEKELNR
ncbi:MAG: DUF2997 domain-containing protein [Methanosphaera sp.]|nr:DUF2997 domain-containing protein [Methanosphaera sp.]